MTQPSLRHVTLTYRHCNRSLRKNVVLFWKKLLAFFVFFLLLTFFCRTDGPLSRWRVEQTDLCQSDGFVEIWGTNFFTSIWKGHRRLPKFFRLRKTIFKRYLYQGVSLNTFKLKHSKHDVKNIYFRVKTRTSNNSLTLRASNNAYSNFYQKQNIENILPIKKMISDFSKFCPTFCFDKLFIK